jgi:cyanophycinase
MSADAPESAKPKPRRRRRIVWGSTIGLLLFALGAGLWICQPPHDESERVDFLNRFQGGSLMIAGGGRLPIEIRQRFLDLAGGSRRAKIVVIPAYDPNATQSAGLLDVWQSLGVESVRILHSTSRDESNRAEFVRPLEEATGVWLSGGQQSWLSQHYVGTLVEDKLRAVVDRGGAVGGSSAGAAAMTRVMIEQGVEEATEGVGFDLFHDAVIDQHFLRRSRLNRLIGLMESHPHLTAFGIDEGTALVVQVSKGRLGVIGSSYVLAYVPETEAGTPRFETLKHGDQIDLAGLKSGRVKVSSPADLDAALADE